MNDFYFSVLPADKLFSQFPWVGNGCGQENKLRGASVKPADPLKPPKNLCNVTPEYSAVGMHFIDDHEAQLLPEGLPLTVVWQQGIMEHVRIGEQNMGMIPSYFGSLIGGGIPVVDRCLEAGLVVPGAERFEKHSESFQLVPGQGLDREEIQCPLLRVLEECFSDSQVINERLAACGRGCYNNVAPCADALESLGLMFIEAAYAQSGQGIFQDSGERVPESAVICLLSRKNGMMDDFEPLPSVLQQNIQEPLNHL
jgi:hypothetical protein